MSIDTALRIGVAGVGHLGKVHARLWKEVEDAELIGVFDTDSSASAELAAEHGVKSFSSLGEMLQQVDALSIVTPTFAHYDVAKYAIEQGKHVLIEKPITRTTAEAEELIALAVQKDVRIQVGHIERFNPALLSVEKYLQQPKFFESHRMAQFKPRGTDVPVVLDLMVHDIDVILSLVKSPVHSVEASGVAVVSDEIDIANARIRFENGAVANVTASRISQNPMRKLRVFEKNAYVSIDFAAKSAEVFRLMDSDKAEEINTMMKINIGEIDQADNPKTVVYERPAVKELNPLKYELELFCDAIKTGKRPIVSGEDGLEALRVAEMILQKIREV